MSCKKLRIFAACVALAAVAVVSAVSVDMQALLPEAQAHAGVAAAWVQAHPLLSPGVFLCCATLGTMTPFPGAILIMLTGGFLFGSISGGLLAASGATLSAGLVCAAGRRLLASSAEKPHFLLQKAASHKPTGDALYYLLALRLLPGMPAWLTNLVPVPLRIMVRTVLVATLLGILPICLIVASIGNGIAALGAEHAPISVPMMLRPRYLAPLLSLAILALLPLALRRMMPHRFSPERRS